MIIGISGKVGSGKDTIGQIIQYLVSKKVALYTFPHSEKDFREYLSYHHNNRSTWEIRKFADKLKELACLLIGCSRFDLENIDFKNSLLGEEWQVWTLFKNGKPTAIIYPTEKEALEALKKVNNSTSSYFIYTCEKSQRTIRWLLQYIGTELLRDRLHTNTHVNALFAEYEPKSTFELDPIGSWDSSKGDKLPKWIITDVRFLNEVEAIKQRKGLLIRVNRYTPGHKKDEHFSETALDDYEGFDEVIANSGTIDDLIKSVESILKKHNIL